MKTLNTYDYNLLKVEDVARQLNVSKRTVAQLFASKSLPFVKIGRCVRVNRDAVLEFIQNRTISCR